MYLKAFLNTTNIPMFRKTYKVILQSFITTTSSAWMGKVIHKISKRAETMKNSVLADINQCIKINKQKKTVDIVLFTI